MSPTSKPTTNTEILAKTTREAFRSMAVPGVTLSRSTEAYSINKNTQPNTIQIIPNGKMRSKFLFVFGDIMGWIYR
jgi:hypothetical protein